MSTRIFLGVAVLLCAGTVFGFTYNTDQAGGVTITVEKIDKITEFDLPQTVKCRIENKNDSPITVSPVVSSIETVSIKGQNQWTIDVPGNGSAEITFEIVASPGTYSAHYPVHVRANAKVGEVNLKLHAVLVVETDFGSRGATPQIVGQNAAGNEVRVGDRISDPNDLPVTTLTDGTGLFLPNSRAYRVVWNHDRSNEKITALPVGFTGIDTESAASFDAVNMSRGGVARESFSVHPPWRGGTGNVAAEYRLRLPQSDKITFSFYGAMRDIHPGEPESDGITFRVWVDDRADSRVVCEKHIAEKQWVPVQCDLTQYAGKEITLRLESDPGPRRDPTCDNGFWGDPLIFCGEKPKMLSADEKTKLFEENLAAIKDGQGSTSQIYHLDGIRAAVSFGNDGLLDGIIGFGDAGAQVQYDGLFVWLNGQRLGSPSSAIACAPWTEIKPGEYEQSVRLGDRELKMTYTIRQSGGALQISVHCSDDDAITKIEFGPATKHAGRVYFGHGYCVEEPEAFQLTSDGHVFPTSHIGFDFENGLSLLMASTFPPDYIAVDPNIKKYTLGVHPGTTFTLLPGTSGAMDCAIRYRPISDKQPAPGVKKKAGRFALDWWGGTFRQQAERIQELADYGVTDALVVAHNWQRWGYDNRLPDIWPPNPRIGSIEDAQAVIELCKKYDILYGLHDNYIDIYPDADGFHYDLVSFERNGVPRRGWLNHGIDAQAYHFRPDTILPFVERNFDLMTPHLKQTAYFVDVFSSIYIMDYWDRDGNFHSRRKARDYWCQAFDLIRERLGDDNPTICEAGSDFLIGHLDGSDCQFLTLSEFPGDFRIVLRCQKWARIPWHDAVNHTKFSLHGVGYDSRYAANRGYGLHGYSSDDYISTEILTGHPGQVGWNTPLRETVRKYWLIQPLIRELADKEIAAFEFVDDDVHRQRIVWSGNGVAYRIFVNQGREDWTIPGVAYIPQYGFQAVPIIIGNHDAPKSRNLVLAGIARRADGQIAEMSSLLGEVGSHFWLPERTFVNPRTVVLRNDLPTIPIAENFRHLGGNKFQLDVNWKLFRSMKDRDDVKDYAWFLHLEEPQAAWFHRPQLVSVAGGQPPVPVSQWEKDQRIPTGEIALSDDLAPGTYNVLIGLWDEKGNQQRAPILGLTPDNSRVKLGRLTVEKRADQIVNMQFEPEKEDAPELFERLLPNIVFGDTSTVFGDNTVAFLLEFDGDKSVAVTPLPGEPAGVVAHRLGKPSAVIAVDRTGKTIREVPFEYSEANDIVKFSTQPGEFSYKILP